MQDVIAYIDSAMNKWLTAIPDHCKSCLSPGNASSSQTGLVRWDPHREDIVLFNQSATLHVAFYTLQISVHRNFLMPGRKSRAYFFPSLAICANAARSISHILDIQLQRNVHPLSLQLVRQVGP